MKYLVTFVCFGMLNSYALDINKYKEKLRSHMQDMLGTNTTNKLLGEAPKKKEYSVEMPKIPEFESSSTDLNSLNKNIPIKFQGEKFENLTIEQKRPYRVSFIKELYQVTSQTEAKDEDIINALNGLEQGGDREGAYRGVVLGRIYRSMETFVQAPSDKLLDFVNFYAEKFLRKAFDNEAMKRLSFYSIKRVIVEKTLELLDVMAPEASDIHAWYAIFSADLARKYPDVLVNKVRSQKSDAYHYEWSKKVPFQQIKSEVIIKLHMVMNSLDEPIGKKDS